MTDSELRFCGQPLSSEQRSLICDCVRLYPALSLEELAATVCEWLDWRRPNGRLKTRECRALLQQMHEYGLVSLPALRAGRPRGATTSVPTTAQGEAGETLTAPLSEVQPLRLRRVQQDAEQQLWRELVGRYHDRGYRTPYGSSLRYLIETDHPTPRQLGCLQFSSPAWRMKARDLWIGWDDHQRRQYLPRVINNSRFLLLPWVRIPNLASHALALALKAAIRDWEQLYGLRPWLAETLVDHQRFSGHCYRAANWINVGQTTGRGRHDKTHQRQGMAPKQIWLYPLYSKTTQHLQGF